MIFFSTLSIAQVQEKQNFTFNQSNFDIVILQIDSTTLNNTSVVDNNNLSSEQLKDSLIKTGDSFLAFNVAPTDVSGNLIGLYINNGKTKQSINNGNGTGNFYLKPNGFWGIEKNNFRIFTSDKYANKNSYRQAAQSGPMLVIDGNINTLFDPNSVNKNIRIGVGTFSKNGIAFLVVIRSQNEVSFYEFAKVFKDKFNCSNALYLDGGDHSVLFMPSNTLRGTLGSNISKILIFKI